MKTPYSPRNAALTERGHTLARAKVYPALFNADPGDLSFDAGTLLSESPRGAVLDGELATDRVVRVKSPGFRIAIPFTVQERFRAARFARYRDLTVTEWNPLSDTPSELYKLGALYFVYGYLNETLDDFLEVLCIETAAILRGVVTGALEYSRGHNPRTGQPFLTIPFSTLFAAECVAYRYTPKVIALPTGSRIEKSA